MLWVTIVERWVRYLAPDQHRPARVHEDLVADERQISDRERRPGVTMAAAADSDTASGMHVRADKRPAAANLEPGPDVGQLADGEDLGALDGRPGSGRAPPLDQEVGSDQDVPSSRKASSAQRPVGGRAPPSRREAGRERPPARRAGARRTPGPEPRPLVRAEARGQADVLGRRTGQHGISTGPAPACAAAREPRRPRR